MDVSERPGIIHQMMAHTARLRYDSDKKTKQNSRQDLQSKAAAAKFTLKHAVWENSWGYNFSAE